MQAWYEHLFLIVKSILSILNLKKKTLSCRIYCHLFSGKKFACGHYTKSFVRNVEVTCAPTFKKDGEEGYSPVNCWVSCTGGSLNGPDHEAEYPEKGGIVWKKDRCGCVEISKMGTCEKSNDTHDYEYYENYPVNCIISGYNGMFLYCFHITQF